jgi:general secretion pathway protein J
MMNRWCRQIADQSGFTILETLIATLLMTIVLTALATITAQWMPNWNRGMARVQQLEKLGVGLDRIVSDLAAAEFVPVGTAQGPFFDGTPLAVTFVRTSVGLNAEPGLEFVRLIERAEKSGLVLARETRSFRPDSPGPIQFGNPVVLIRAPYRVSFSYMGRDREWRTEWHGVNELPRLVRISVREAPSDKPVLMSTIAAVQVDARADCARAEPVGQCLAGGARTDRPISEDGQAAAPPAGQRTAN